MIIPVHMFAFAKEGDRSKVRPVDIPADGDVTKIPEAQIEDFLELTFIYGQNEKQKISNMPSVSVGDIAQINGRYFMVAPTGWIELSKEEFDNLTPPTSLSAYNKSI